MKIINRDQFLDMPANTVYFEFEPCVFGPMRIKGDTIGNDWFYTDICSFDGDKEMFFDIYDDMIQTGRSQPLDMDVEGRDGTFDCDQMYAVLDNEDIKHLIGHLQRCIK